jgi:hypothetical protein
MNAASWSGSVLSRRLKQGVSAEEAIAVPITGTRQIDAWGEKRQTAPE